MCPMTYVPMKFKSNFSNHFYKYIFLFFVLTRHKSTNKMKFDIMQIHSEIKLIS